MKLANKFKRFTLVSIILFCCLALSGCKNYENFANEINAAYDQGNPYTYNQVMIKLGDTFDKSVQEAPGKATGSCCWYAGYGSSDSARTRFMRDNENGKKIKSIMVEFKNGDAVRAVYYVFNEK